MKSAKYYRDAAARLRRLASGTDAESAEILRRAAVDLSDIAIDIEDGLIEFLNPEAMPQRRHERR